MDYEDKFFEVLNVTLPIKVVTANFYFDEHEEVYRVSIAINKKPTGAPGNIPVISAASSKVSVDDAFNIALDDLFHKLGIAKEHFDIR